MFRFFWKKRRDRGGKGGKDATMVDVDLVVAPAGAGDYTHRFGGCKFVNEDGDLDFTDIKGPVAVTIRIAGKSERGVAFAGSPENAIALAPEKLAERGKCPAMEAMKCDQFYDFSLSDDKTALSFMDKNIDKSVYFYALRFLNAKGCAHVFDPKIKNGGDHV